MDDLWWLHISKNREGKEHETTGIFGCIAGLQPDRQRIGNVSANEFPNMVGIWEGSSEAVVLGNAFYYKDNAVETTPRVSSAKFTLNLTHQEGSLFWGTLTSNHMTESWIGTFWNDAQSFQAVDSDGQVVGRMIDKNAMQLVYTQTGSTLITSHVVFSRKQ